MIDICKKYAMIESSYRWEHRGKSEVGKGHGVIHENRS